MSAPCTLLPWDSAHWGFPVARFCGHKLDAISAKSAIRWCEENGVRCLYFAADGSGPETLRCAWEYGFQFVDLRNDMEKTSLGTHTIDPSEVSCRFASDDDLASIKQLARCSYRDTRFFKDAHFDAERAADLYSRWIARDLRQNTVFVAVSPLQPKDVLGFLSVSRESVDTDRIGLVAVSPDARGRGIARQMLRDALSWSHSRGTARVRVATQGTNVSAVRLYESCGFKLFDVKVWFHRWFTT